MNSAPKTAYLLITHGSRDPRSQAGAEKLADQLRERFGLQQQPHPGQSHRTENSPIAAIATAVLELGPAPLHIQIQQFAQDVAKLGITQIKLLPLFLLPGVHVRQDLPEELAQAQSILAQHRETANIFLELLPHLGADDALVPVLRAQQQALLAKFSQAQASQAQASQQQALSAQCFLAQSSQPELSLAGLGATSGSGRASAILERQSQKHHSSLAQPSPLPEPCPLTEPSRLRLSDVDWVVVAHGSRRSAAVEAIAALAKSIDAQAAYWVGSPSITDYVEARRNQGESMTRPLGLLSYFLFEGGITDRLEIQLQEACAKVDSVSNSTANSTANSATHSTTAPAAPASFSQPLSAFEAWVDVVAEAIERSR